MRRSIAFSAIAELGATLSMVATFHIASDRWGMLGFAEWIMARRVLAFLLPLVTFGLDVGLPRAIARSPPGDGEGYLWAAVAIVLAMAASMGIVLLPLDQWIASQREPQPSRSEAMRIILRATLVTNLVKE